MLLKNKQIPSGNRVDHPKGSWNRGYEAIKDDDIVPIHFSKIKNKEKTYMFDKNDVWGKVDD